MSITRNDLLPSQSNNCSRVSMHERLRTGGRVCLQYVVCVLMKKVINGAGDTVFNLTLNYR